MHGSHRLLAQLQSKDMFVAEGKLLSGCNLVQHAGFDQLATLLSFAALDLRGQALALLAAGFQNR